MNRTFFIPLLALSICLGACNEKPEAFDPDIKNNSLAVSPDESVAVVCASGIDFVNIYDLRTDSLIKTINEVVTPRNIAFSKDGTVFYISDSSYGNIREYDSRTFKLLRTFPLAKGVFGFAVDDKNQRIYANNQAENTVSVLNTATGEVDKVINGFNGPRQGIVLADDNRHLYVTNFKSDDVKVVDISTDEIIKTLPGIPAVRQISVDTQRNILYGASSKENAIYALDIATGNQIARIPVGEEPYGAKLSPDRSILLSGEKGSNSISVIRTDSLTIDRTVRGLDGPRQAIVYSTANPGRAYILNADLSVSVIDYHDNTIVKTIGKD